jgi:hypothetical protein
MFEIVIFCVIVFAVAYWAVLFIMSRRDDVLHGEFVKAEPPNKDARVRPPVAPASPVTAKPNAPPLPIATSVSPPALANLPPANTETLQSLLVSLKQELKNASRI